MRKFLSLFAVLVLALSVFSGAAFAYSGGPLDGKTSGDTFDGVIFVDPTPEVVSEFTDALSITKDPGSEKKKAGDEVVFTATATGSDYVVWYFIAPDGKVYDCANIGDVFKGCTATGTRGDRLVLSNVTSKMDGCLFYAAYTAGDLTLNTGRASLTIEGSNLPTPSPTPLPTPTPSPALSTGVNGMNGGNNGGGVTSGGTSSTGITANGANGGVSMMGTNNQNYNSDIPVGSEASVTEPTATGYNNTTIENTRGKTHAGAYILAALAGLVIIGSVLLMALYMRGKVSLGKFEKFLGNVGGSDSDMFNDENYYDPKDGNTKL